MCISAAYSYTYSMIYTVLSFSYFRIFCFFSHVILDTSILYYVYYGLYRSHDTEHYTYISRDMGAYHVNNDNGIRVFCSIITHTGSTENNKSTRDYDVRISASGSTGTHRRVHWSLPVNGSYVIALFPVGSRVPIYMVSACIRINLIYITL